jgi:selenocysteine lyase/cysteine desulfurase
MSNFLTFPQAQAQFPQAEETYYLNHAAVSPWPLRSEQALSNFAKENVLTGAQKYLQWLKVEERLRDQLAQLIGITSSSEIALAKNTSEALSIIAYGIDWQEGDEVIISNQEFPSNRIVWQSLASKGVTTTVANISEHDPITAIRNKITARTRLISISSVQYASGLTIDLPALSQLCKENNCLLCVDAIQSLGAMPFDQKVIDADFIVADGHKWMMAAEGLALLYVKNEHINTLKLHQYGWHMVKDRGNYDALEWEPANDATRFECGSPNMLGTHVLSASLSLLLEIGIDNVHEALIQRVDYLKTELGKIHQLEILNQRNHTQNEADLAKNTSGIVCFRIEGRDSKALYQALMAKGVICANRGGGIRFSPHFYTSKQVIDKSLAILKELIS